MGLLKLFKNISKSDPLQPKKEKYKMSQSPTWLCFYFAALWDLGSSCPGAQQRISFASCREEAKGSEEDKGSQEGDGPGV